MRIRNLHLALVALLVTFAFGSSAAAMTFERLGREGGCPTERCVLARGGIVPDTADDFQAFLKANPASAGDLMILDSQGGDLLASLKVGTMVRKAGLSTTVQAVDPAKRLKKGGECASACVYIFLGGVERTLGNGAKIGVHQIYTADNAWRMSAQDGLNLMSLVAVHVNKLCGTLDVLIPTMRTPPQQMHWLSSVELSRYAILTETGQAD